MDSNVSVTFNEAVTAPASAFDLACTDTGTHALALSGGPTTFTLDPDDNFAQLEHCTVTVDGAAVSDVDGIDPPDTMDADASTTFQVGPEQTRGHRRVNRCSTRRVRRWYECMGQHAD